jgi:hypothetical protein
MILWTLLTIFLAFYALWVFYLAVMNLKRVRDLGQLHKTALVLGYPVLVVGYALDVILNVVVMTVILLEWPQETTISSRLKRHNRIGTGWRMPIVRFFEPLLDPFDPSGDHI